MSGAGLSKARLERMHEVLGGYVERGVLPGLVSVVDRRGEVHLDPIGTTAVDGGAAMRADTIFRISSMTKPVTAVATLILVEECRLRLDEPVDRFLPELADRQVLRTIESAVDDTVPAPRPITVRDLLTFRLGFGGLWTAEPLPILDALDAVGLAVGPPQPALDARSRRVDATDRHPAVDVPAGRAVDVQHRLRSPRRAGGTRVRPAVRGVPARADLRAARHGRHELQRPAREARPLHDELRDRPGDGRALGLRRARRSVEPTARVPARERRVGVDRAGLRRLRPDAPRRSGARPTARASSPDRRSRR